MRKLLLFLLLIFIPLAYAADVCCEKTIAGDYCRYTDSSNCDLDVRQENLPVTCESTDYCRVGCCYTPEGSCTRNAGLAECVAADSHHIASCDAPQCRKGCCIADNQCSFTTQGSCHALQAVEKEFKVEIVSESVCISKCTSSDEGCCIGDDSSCKYLTREECGQLFVSNYCSSLAMCSYCNSQDHKGCYDDDIYWYDSCGNREEKAQDCDYGAGTMCGKVNNDFVCKSTACGERKNGESWCEYDGATGKGVDLVGSRHFRKMCVNGDIITEPCKDYRGEICVQGLVNTQRGAFSEAICRKNRYQTCTQCDDRSCCTDLNKRDCIWAGTDENGRCIPNVPPGISFWKGDRFVRTGSRSNAICSQGNVDCTVYYVKRPLLGRVCKENCECLKSDFITATNSYCRSLGDCGAHYNFVGDYSDKGYEENSPGDVVKEGFGVFSTAAEALEFGTFELSKTEPLIGIAVATSGVLLGRASSSYLGMQSGALGMPSIKELSQSFGITGPAATTEVNFAKITSKEPLTIEKNQQITFSDKTFRAQENTKLTPSGENNFLIEGTGVLIDNDGRETIVGKDTGVQSLNLEKGAKGELGRAPLSKLQAVTGLLSWSLFVGGALQTIYALLKEVEEEKIEFTCLPWVAPEGGGKCSKCGDDGKECSLYRCKSLGQNCEFLAENAGTDKKACYDKNPNDANSPLISPWPDILTARYSINILDNGFEITPEVRPYEKISLGIITNEPAQCRIDTKHTGNFNAMASYFNRDSSFQTEHAMNLSLVPGQEYDYYIRCSDPIGNKNIAEYLVRIRTEALPDITPPLVAETSIVNRAFIRNDVDEVPFEINLNEPAGCRWSYDDKAYSLMNNTFNCSSLQDRNLFYPCQIILPVETTYDNLYYIRCEDTKNNVNVQSFEFYLTKTSPLLITSTLPSGPVYDTASPTIQIRTAEGAENGEAICAFSAADKDFSNMVKFFETSSSVHSQQLSNLELGDYLYYVRCRDVAGNEANTTAQFSVAKDLVAPKIEEMYTDSSTFYLTLNEPSLCEYSSESFEYGSGTKMTGNNVKQHTASKQHHYYIICADVYGNNMEQFIVYTQDLS